MQIWPVFMVMPRTIAGTALSRSASANTTCGDLPPSSRCNGRQVLRAGSHDRRTGLRGAGEAEPADARVRGERRSGLVAVAGDHVDHTGGNAGLLGEPGQRQRGQRGVLGRLDHDRVAGTDGRGDVVEEHRRGCVPRDDRADHAVRLAHGEAERRGRVRGQ